MKSVIFVQFVILPLLLSSFNVFADTPKGVVPSSSEKSTNEMSDTHEDYVKTKSKYQRVVYVNPPKFSDIGVSEAVKNECSMLPILKTSLGKYLSDKGYTVKLLAEPLGAKGLNVLNVEYTRVEASKMSGLTLRPGSIAYFRISLFDDGVEVHSIENRISSKVALKACERLDKIADATGRYAAKWVSALKK